MTEVHNVDDQELAKFEELAYRWWDPEGEFKPLHDINPLRLSYIESKVGLAGKRVLDVGCGGGLLSEAMASRGALVTGIDMGDAPLGVARLHALEAGIDLDYQKATAESLAEEARASFDVITCMELLEHVPDPASTINACAKLLSPEGFAFFSTINRNPKAYLLAIIGAEYVLRMLPKGTHDYDKFIRPAELGRWMRQADLELCDLSGMTYNPLTRRYSLGEDVGVNYLAYGCHASPYDPVP